MTGALNGPELERVRRAAQKLFRGARVRFRPRTNTREFPRESTRPFTAPHSRRKHFALTSCDTATPQVRHIQHTRSTTCRAVPIPHTLFTSRRESAQKCRRNARSDTEPSSAPDHACRRATYTNAISPRRRVGGRNAQAIDGAFPWGNGGLPQAAAPINERAKKARFRCSAVPPCTTAHTAESRLNSDDFNASRPCGDAGSQYQLRRRISTPLPASLASSSPSSDPRKW